MNRIAFILAILAAAAAITWRFPLWHVVPLKEDEAKKQSQKFNAEKFAADFWTSRLTPALADAPDAATVLAALEADAAEARNAYGRKVGLSRSAFFLVRGNGNVVAVEDSRIGIALDESATEPDLWLVTGRIFGNAVRDSTGLIRSQDFPNSQHFNEVASALNALVEQRVLPSLEKLKQPGPKIQFVACVEILGGTVRPPLKLIPLAVKTD